jgi:hypothetical protein
MEVDEVTILTGWAEGVAEALAYTSERTGDLLDDAGENASWRDDVGLAKPPLRVMEAD